MKGILLDKTPCFPYSEATKWEDAMERDTIRFAYWTHAVMAVLVGCLAILSLLFSPFQTLSLYFIATGFRILAGSTLKSMLPEDCKDYNARYHRWIVISMNGGMVAALLIHGFYSLPIDWTINTPLIAGVLIYLVVQRFSRPHSLVARLRSSTLTCLIVSVLLVHALHSAWYAVTLFGFLFIGSTLYLLREMEKEHWSIF